jgi:hypothetical protein
VHEAEGLPRQGPALLLAPVVPVGVVNREHTRDDLNGQLAAKEASNKRQRSGSHAVR